jgi:hypothetical protein
MEKILRAVNTGALLGILAVMILILVRLPQAQHFPNLNNFLKASDDQKKILLQNLPLVRVTEVGGTVSVDVTNYKLKVSVDEPLRVEVDNY